MKSMKQAKEDNKKKQETHQARQVVGSLSAKLKAEKQQKQKEEEVKTTTQPTAQEEIIEILDSPPRVHKERKDPSEGQPN